LGSAIVEPGTGHRESVAAPAIISSIFLNQDQQAMMMAEININDTHSMWFGRGRSGL